MKFVKKILSKKVVRILMYLTYYAKKNKIEFNYIFERKFISSKRKLSESLVNFFLHKRLKTNDRKKCQQNCQVLKFEINKREVNFFASNYRVIQFKIKEGFTILLVASITFIICLKPKLISIQMKICT